MTSVFDRPLSDVFLIISGTTLLRYLFFAGFAYVAVWIVLRSRLLHRRIQKSFPKAKHLRREIGYSLLTVLIFASVGVGMHMAQKAGYTLMYSDFHEYGWGYFFFSLAALILLHDAYFYWAHRLMHHPKIFARVHLVHHKSTDPSPWAALAFHPFEAVLEAGILPMAVMLFPLHVYTLLAFLGFMMFLNVLGHLGFELYPKGFTKSPLTGWNNTATHHNMHHRYFNYNYGLYFNWWDRIMGTNHPKYHETFERITSTPLIGSGNTSSIEVAEEGV